ncbi:MAG: PEPxxWA-CTERM sorting domain-containing protein [Sphingomonadales bacterium]
MGIPIYFTTFTFDVPTYSFGFYTTGLNVGAGAFYSVTFDDTPATIQYMPVNANGGISYWGVVFDAPVQKVEFFRSRNQSIDVFGIDGISFNVAPPPPGPGVPEPGNWALLIAGFGVMGAAQRRRRAALAA